MSVLLINPPPAERVPARIVTPPLGLLYLALSVRAADIGAAVLDADALNLSVSEVARIVSRANPEVVGVTAMSPTSDSAYNLLKALRPVSRRLVIGGPHPSALGQKIFEHCPVELDAVFCGESEESFTEAVKAVTSGKRFADLDLPGLLTPDGDEASREWPRIRDLDSLPDPDRSLVSVKRYRHPLFGREPVTTMITSRGCPYDCIFCDKHVCGKTFRARSPEKVLAEIDAIVLKSGVRRIIIYDDLFTLDRNRVIDICKGIVSRKIDIRFKCEGRVNRVDPEMLSWMKRAGCEMIAFGVETVNPEGLEFLRKKITPDQVREAFAMTSGAGIKTLGYFLLGIPGETVEDELETARFAIEIKADYAQFGALSPFPGTDLYELAVEKGWYRELPARGPAEVGGKRPAIIDGYWDPDRLDRVTREAHRMFYFRPSYIAGRVRSIGSLGEFFGMASQAAGLAGWWARRAFRK